MINHFELSEEEIRCVIDEHLYKFSQIINRNLGGKAIDLSSEDVVISNDRIDDSGREPWGITQRDNGKKYKIKIFRSNINKAMDTLNQRSKLLAAREDIGKFVEYVLAHEIGHVWFFTNYVINIETCKALELKICDNEALASYEVFADNFARYVLKECHGNVGRIMGSIGILLHRENDGNWRNECLESLLQKLIENSNRAIPE